MDLPEDDAELFNLLVEWLYSQRYDIPLPTGDKYKDRARFMEPMRLHVLADKYGVTGLKNCITKSIFDTMKQHNMPGPNITTGAYVYQNVPQISGIRKFLADLHACNVKSAWYEHPNFKPFLLKYPEFATDIIISFVQHTSQNLMYNRFRGEMPEAYQDKD